MERRLVDEDIKIAQCISDDIKNGDNTSLNRWFSSHYSMMFRFVLKKTRHADEANEIIHNFYIELCTGKAFAQYQGCNNCSLKTYITGRLKFRTLPEKARVEDEDNIKSKAPSSNMAIISLEDAEICDEQESLDENLAKMQSRIIVNEIVSEAMDRLSSQYPEDAMLIRWHLGHLTYEDMAKQLLMHNNIYPAEDIINRECARIRKRYTRPGGTLNRFEAWVKQLMDERGLTEADLSSE